MAEAIQLSTRQQAGDFYNARTLYLLSYILLALLSSLHLLRPLLRLVSCRIAPALFFYALLISLPGNGAVNRGPTHAVAVFIHGQ